MQFITRMIPDENTCISKLYKSINSAIPSKTNHMHIQARMLASIIGQIIFMSLAIGPVARLRTRALYNLLYTRRIWSDRLRLSVFACDKLVFGGLP